MYFAQLCFCSTVKTVLNVNLLHVYMEVNELSQLTMYAVC